MSKTEPEITGVLCGEKVWLDYHNAGDLAEISIYDTDNPEDQVYMTVEDAAALRDKLNYFIEEKVLYRWKMT